VRVELFGVPRLLAGRRALDVEPLGPSLADTARALSAVCPALVGPVLDPASGWLVEGYTFAIDTRFVRDPATLVPPRATLLLVASQAGG
jgi:hypothetical protein